MQYVFYSNKFNIEIGLWLFTSHHPVIYHETIMNFRWAIISLNMSFSPIIDHMECYISM